MATVKLHHSEKIKYGAYIKSIVYGGLDGIITTFAIVAGVTGASLSYNIILILGFANLIADGISMAAADYLSTKAKAEYQGVRRSQEMIEIKNHPKLERKELIKFYMKEGLSNKDAAAIVSILSKKKKALADAILIEELELVELKESPIKNGLVTLGSFITFGFIPLITYLIARTNNFIDQNTFLFASVLTGITMFLLGAAKIKISPKHWFDSGLEILFIGGFAALCAYGIGFFVASII